MSLKKVVISTLLALSATAGVAGSGIAMSSCAANIENNEDNTFNSDDTGIIDASKYILDTITEKGYNIITGGIETYAKNLVLNVLKDYGFDFRDQSIKYLEKVLEQLEVIKYKLDNMDKKMDEYNAQYYINNLTQKLKKTELEYMGIVKDGLWTIAQHEQSGEYSEEQLETERKQYYKDVLEKMKVSEYEYFPNYVSDLADYILNPNPGDLTKNIFYYYGLTLGKYDKWTSQEYQNKRAYIAYLDTMLLTAVNVAKFDTYYRVQGKGEATVNTYKGYMDAMAAKVNKVNGVFQEELKRLDEIEKVRQEQKIITYLPTNTQYSTRLAALTYNPNDQTGELDSRQALMMANINVCRGGYMDEGYAYEPNRSIIDSVRNDYQVYVNSYGAKDYTLVKYLQDIGFYSKYQNLYDNAAGLYYGNTQAVDCGYLNHDTDLKTQYVDLNGNVQTKTVYQVCAYHSWIGTISRFEFRYCDDKYYLCFIKADQKYLDGNYRYNHFDTVGNSISNHLVYSVRHSWSTSLPVEVHDAW